MGKRLLTSWKLCIARPHCLRLLEHCVRAAASRTFCTAGNRSPIKMAIMAMTTSSSISVKPRLRDRVMGRLRLNENGLRNCDNGHHNQNATKHKKKTSANEEVQLGPQKNVREATSEHRKHSMAFGRVRCRFLADVLGDMPRSSRSHVDIRVLGAALGHRKAQDRLFPAVSGGQLLGRASIGAFARRLHGKRDSYLMRSHDRAFVVVQGGEGEPAARLGVPGGRGPR